MSEFQPRTYEQVRTLNQLDIEISPGFKVRDLQTFDECTNALLQLEFQISRIVSQIARAEMNPQSVRPGWRTQAQGAIRWKKKAMKAIRGHQEAIGRTAAPPAKSKKGAAILRVIREDIGEAAFEEYVTAAQRRYPDAFGPVDNGDE